MRRNSQNSFVTISRVLIQLHVEKLPTVPCADVLLLSYLQLFISVWVYRVLRNRYIFILDTRKELYD